MESLQAGPLPAVHPHLRSVPPDEGIGAEVEELLPAAPDAGEAGRVLVVDDEAPIVSVAIEVLRCAGYAATGLTRAEQALGIDPRRFDVLVTDYRMPGLDGLALFRHLRQENPHLVGVIVTGYGSLNLVRTAMQSGFSAILLKPFPLDRLTAAVDRALRQRRLTAENFRLTTALEVYAAGQDLNRPRTRDELVALLARLARETVQADTAAAILADPQNGCLHGPEAVDGLGRPPWLDAMLGAPAVDVLASTSDRPESDCRLVVPLVVGEQIEGLLVVDRPGRPLQALDHERLSLLANQAALAASHLRLFEEELRDQKLALVGRMAGAITDRVREPVRAIAELAARLEVDEPDYLTMINEATRRLEVMCAELSDFVSGSDSLALQPCSVRSLLEGLARRMGTGLAGRGVRVAIEIRSDATLLIDSRKLTRALENLVKNAEEAMPHGGLLSLRFQVAEERAILEVADTGCGMPPDVQARVFEPFFTHGKAGGTGLGGAVIRSAVAAHGGRVEVSSTVGAGTTFRIILPRRRGEDGR